MEPFILLKTDCYLSHVTHWYLGITNFKPSQWNVYKFSLNIYIWHFSSLFLTSVSYLSLYVFNLGPNVLEWHIGSDVIDLPVNFYCFTVDDAETKNGSRLATVTQSSLEKPWLCPWSPDSKSDAICTEHALRSLFFSRICQFGCSDKAGSPACYSSK